MKLIRILLILSLGGPTVFAQSTTTASVSGAVAFSPDQIDQLVAPIALYPDPLIAVLLPAATDWPDLSAAGQLVQTNADPSTIDAQPWDQSVKALAHYPQVVSWMDENPDWTQQLGSAFADQSGDVMNSIQRLRANARASGILVDTPQQQVIVQYNQIYIEPTQPDMIYIPSYDPQIFVMGSRWHGPGLSFSVGLSAGPWLAYNFDWRQRSVWIDRRANVVAQRNWRTYAMSPAPTAQREAWRPRVDLAQRAPARVTREVTRPAPFGERRAEAPRAVTQQPPVRTERTLPPTGRTYVNPYPPAVRSESTPAETNARERELEQRREVQTRPAPAPQVQAQPQRQAPPQPQAQSAPRQDGRPVPPPRAEEKRKGENDKDHPNANDGKDGRPDDGRDRRDGDDGRGH